MTGLIHRYLENSADLRPHLPAVADADDVMTFAELDARANRIAHLLVELDVDPGDLVGVYLDKSHLAVAAQYAVMKAGAAYVPLDPKAPPPRLAKVAEDAGFEVVLTSRSRLNRLPAVLGERASSTTIVVLDADGNDSFDEGVMTRADVEHQPSHRLGLDITESDLAYVLYTSGSTGSPKGVALSHGNGSSFVNWAVDALDLVSSDRLSSHASFHFDLSVFDLYASAAVGACVHLVPSSLSVFPLELSRFIDERDITIWYSVPTILNSLAEQLRVGSRNLPSLRTVVFAGEVFPTPALRRAMSAIPHARFWNWYGPTETNVCTAHLVDAVPDTDDDVPIGHPIAGTEAVVVDASGRPVEGDQAGELLVCGPTVMRGYWNDEQRTAQRLVPHPQRSGAVAYRTGDIVRRHSDGALRYVGRLDHQIKTRGYRVDLGDVESTICGYASVGEAAVIPVADSEVSNTLHAFVVLRNGATTADVHRHCRNELPPYMVPDVITEIEALPRTSNLKIDRGALTELTRHRTRTAEETT